VTAGERTSATLVLQSQFGRTPPGAAAITFVGPLIRSLIRPLGGWLADRLGGARVTLWNYFPATALASLRASCFGGGLAGPVHRRVVTTYAVHVRGAPVAVGGRPQLVAARARGRAQGGGVPAAWPAIWRRVSRWSLNALRPAGVMRSQVRGRLPT